MEEGKVTEERVGGAIGGGAENEVYDEDEDLLVATAKNPKRSTFLLASLVLLGIGFLGGMEYQKHEGTSSASAGGATGGSGARFASGLGAGGSPRSGGGASSFRSLFSGGGAGGSGGLGGFVAGTVANISGDTLYVTESSGNTVAVSTTGSAFSKTVAGSVGDVLPGDTVTVRGSKQPDGSYEATSVSISPAGAAPGGIGGPSPTSSGGATGGAPAGGGSSGGATGGTGSFGPFG